MARMMSRRRVREGRGLGERLSESAVYIVIVVALVLGGRWYFFQYLRSPGPALQNFLSQVNAGKVENQYNLLTAETKKQYPSAKEYARAFPLAQGIAARLQNYTITSEKVTGDTAKLDVSTAVRKSGQELYQAELQKFTDHYVMKRENGSWKVDLGASNIQTIEAADIAEGMPL